MNNHAQNTFRTNALLRTDDFDYNKLPERFLNEVCYLRVSKF